MVKVFAALHLASFAVGLVFALHVTQPVKEGKIRLTFHYSDVNTQSDEWALMPYTVEYCEKNKKMPFHYSERIISAWDGGKSDYQEAETEAAIDDDDDDPDYWVYAKLKADVGPDFKANNKGKWYKLNREKIEPDIRAQADEMSGKLGFGPNSMKALVNGTKEYANTGLPIDCISTSEAEGSPPTVSSRKTLEVEPIYSQENNLEPQSPDGWVWMPYRIDYKTGGKHTSYSQEWAERIIYAKDGKTGQKEYWIYARLRLQQLDFKEKNLGRWFKLDARKLWNIIDENTDIAIKNNSALYDFGPSGKNTLEHGEKDYTSTKLPIP